MAGMLEGKVVAITGAGRGVGTEFDLDMTSEHGRAPDITAINGVWKQRMTGVGSEWSAQFPGYVAGAIEAASIGVKGYLERRKI